MTYKPKMTKEERAQKRLERLNDEASDKYYSNPYTMPPECDACCRFRSCYNKYENKGSFTIGRGYTSYHTTFRPACATRLHQGCPSRDGEFDDTFDKEKAYGWIREQLDILENQKPKIKTRRAIYAHVPDLLKCMAEWDKKRDLIVEEQRKELQSLRDEKENKEGEKEQ